MINDLNRIAKHFYLQSTIIYSSKQIVLLKKSSLIYFISPAKKKSDE
jgi:hypothetical protein